MNQLYSVWPCVEQYQYMKELRRLSGCTPVVSMVLPRLSKEIVTPLRWEALDYFLVNHPDQEYRRYIVEGLREGFGIGFNYKGWKGCKKATSNMVSTMQKPEIVREYLSKECTEGWVLGPLPPELFSSVQISRIGVIPKGSTGNGALLLTSQYLRVLV